MDLDILLRMETDNILRFVEVARALALRPRAPVPLESFADPELRRSWIEDKGALVFTVQSDDGLIQIDSFLSYPVPWDNLHAEARMADLGGFQVLVSSVRHLIQAKEAIVPARPRDLADLTELRNLL